MRSAECFVLAFALLLPSCRLFLPPSVEFDESEFKRERAAWESASIDDYAFTQRFYPDSGPQPGIVHTVSGGVLSSTEVDPADRESGWTDFNPEDPYVVRIPTIDGVYDWIASTVEEQKEGIDSGKVRILIVEIDYDEQYHFPAKVLISVIRYESLDGGSCPQLDIYDFKPE